MHVSALPFRSASFISYSNLYGKDKSQIDDVVVLAVFIYFSSIGVWMRQVCVECVLLCISKYGIGAIRVHMQMQKGARYYFKGSNGWSSGSSEEDDSCLTIVLHILRSRTNFIYDDFKIALSNDIIREQ